MGRWETIMWTNEDSTSSLCLLVLINNCSSMWKCIVASKSLVELGHGWVITSHRKLWDLITYQCPNLIWIMLVKEAPVELILRCNVISIETLIMMIRWSHTDCLIFIMVITNSGNMVFTLKQDPSFIIFIRKQSVHICFIGEPWMINLRCYYCLNKTISLSQYHRP